MTQQDIVNELNKMIIGYNINWNMIKYDADKAIMKINAHLGAEFPMMSTIMLSPNHRYTIKYKHKDLPIFPERYILTVVIPFIATEILARDEEFTTIYNKYAMDFENGLFDMFQNEFNKVLPVFRQDPDVGVFFSEDSVRYKQHKQLESRLPDIAYNVYYHFNEQWADVEQFSIDPKKYKYGSSIIVKDSTIKEFIKDLTVYKFVGWMLEPNDTTIISPEEEILDVTSDIHLYAKWKKECILNVNDSGTVTINSTYADKLINLDIPSIINGKRVSIIPTDFDTDAYNLVRVTLPRTDLTIAQDAFTQPSIREFILPTYDYLRNYPNYVNIAPGAINLSGVDYLYIPYSVTGIGLLGINNVHKIQCEVETKPERWSGQGTNEWTNTPDDNIEWGVVNNG